MKLTPCPYPCFKESSQEKVLGGVKKLIRGVKGVENIYTQENFQKVSFLNLAGEDSQCLVGHFCEIPKAHSFIQEPHRKSLSRQK